MEGPGVVVVVAGVVWMFASETLKGAGVRGAGTLKRCVVELYAGTGVCGSVSRW